MLGRKARACLEIDTLTDKAREAALKYIEREARAILMSKPNLKEFVMGMGVWFFTDKQGKPVNHRDEYYLFVGEVTREYMPRVWVKPLYDFIEYYNELLHLTEYSMRFTKNSPAIKEW